MRLENLPAFRWPKRCWAWANRPCAAAWVIVLTLFVLYGAWWSFTPRGPFEFAYAPFAVEPLPYAVMRGFTYEQLWNHVARFVLLTPALLLLGCQLLAVIKAGPQFKRTGFPLLVMILCTSLCALVVLWILRGRPICDDELVYAMQARFLTEGRIADAHLGFTPPDHFSIPTPSGYTGKYLPGEPFVQMLGVLVGIPALVHLPLLFATLLLWQRTLVARSGVRFAGLSAVALASSPMLILTSATGVSQCSALFGIVLLGYGLSRCEQDAPRWGAVLSALGVGFAILSRPQSAVPAAIILIPLVLLALWRRRSIAGGALLLLIGGAVAGVLLAYNLRVTGHALQLPWFQQCASEHFGFGRVWKHSSFLHTPWTALENLVVVAVRLNAWWLGLPASLLVLLAWCWQGRQSHGQARWLWLGIAVILFESGYYSSGVSDTGAIYHFELLLPGSIVAASVTQRIIDQWGRRGAFAIGGVMLLGAGSFLAEQILRIDRLMDALHSDSDSAMAKVQTPALLFYEQWGAEVLNVGWIMSSFPQRHRGMTDKVVTFPRVSETAVARVREVYPGRSCYYYHRRHDDEQAELLRCEEAQAYLTRGFTTTDTRRALWIEPTAYKLTDYNPFVSLQAHTVRDAKGNPRYPCCVVDETRSLGGKVEPEVVQGCIVDGPSTGSVQTQSR